MPSRKTKMLNVNELPQEEQAAFLADGYAELTERLEKVEAGQETLSQGQGILSERVGAVEGKVDILQKAIQQNSQMAAENNLMLHKVLLAIQGQRDPGLETPGMLDRMKKLEASCDLEKSAREAGAVHTQQLQAWKDQVIWRFKWTIGLGSSALGLLAWKFAPYLQQILELLK